MFSETLKKTLISFWHTHLTLLNKLNLSDKSEIESKESHFFEFGNFLTRNSFTSDKKLAPIRVKCDVTHATQSNKCMNENTKADLNLSNGQYVSIKNHDDEMKSVSVFRRTHHQHKLSNLWENN